MRTFFVALATGGALAMALPAVNALTTAVADDWIATGKPVQLTAPPSGTRKAERPRKARHGEADKEQLGSAAGIAVQPASSPAPNSAAAPVGAQPAR